VLAVEDKRAIVSKFSISFSEMLLLNGGGSLALLAFLQAIWDKANPSFVRGILIGMAFYIGLVFHGRRTVSEV
jgi:hypothetical protein